MEWRYAALTMSVTIAIVVTGDLEGARRTIESIQPIPVEDWEVIEILLVRNGPMRAVDGPTIRDLISLIDIRFVYESKPGFSSSRNKALAEAHGDVLVFIDEDETAEPGWPSPLVDVLVTTGAGMVGGASRVVFDRKPPDWIFAGDSFNAIVNPHLTEMKELYSSNLAIDLAQAREAGLSFDSRFDARPGGDLLFTRQAYQRGMRLVWSRYGDVYRHVDTRTVSLRQTLTEAMEAAQGRTEVDLMTGRPWWVTIKTLKTVGTRLARGVWRSTLGVAWGSSARRVEGQTLRHEARGSMLTLRGYWGARRWNL